MINLDNEVYACCKRLGIDPTQADSFLFRLGIFEIRDKKGYEHSVRLGLFKDKFSSALEINPDLAYLSLQGHDLGKITLDERVIRAQYNGEWNLNYVNKMDAHPLNTYKLLIDFCSYAAQVGLRHHLWQNRGYPSRVPEWIIPLNKTEISEIERASLALGIVDSFDRIKHNGHLGIASKQIEKKLRANFLRHQDMINLLYTKGVLT